MASPRGSIRRGEIKALAAPDIGKPKLLINACMKNQIHQTCVDCEVTRDALVPFVKGSHDVSSMDCCMFFQKQLPEANENVEACPPNCAALFVAFSISSISDARDESCFWESGPKFNSRIYTSGRFRYLYNM